jgi:hypothetical protein
MNNVATLIYFTAPNAYVKSVYLSADRELKCALAECAHNILYGDIDFTDVDREILRKHQPYIKKLSEGKRIPSSVLPIILTPVIGYVCDKGSTPPGL